VHYDSFTTEDPRLDQTRSD